MRYKHLQNAGVDVSALAVGTWAIGGARYGEVTEKDSIDAIHYMFDQGVNLIDTAVIKPVLIPRISRSRPVAPSRKRTPGDHRASPNRYP